MCFMWGDGVMIKLNKNIIYYITEGLNEEETFILNCSNNEIIKLDTVGTEVFLDLINNKKIEQYGEEIKMYRGCGIIE